MKPKQTLSSRMMALASVKEKAMALELLVTAQHIEELHLIRALRIAKSTLSETKEEE